MRRDENKAPETKPRTSVALSVGLIVGLLAVAGALLLFLQPKGTPALVRIYVNEQLWREVPLNEYQTIVVDQGDGKVNEILIDEEGVRMASSTCKNQVCVHTGLLKAGDELMMANNWIVCLPNQVSIELTEAAK